jgi:hypothetical protein
LSHEHGRIRMGQPGSQVSADGLACPSFADGRSQTSDQLFLPAYLVGVEAAA